ncbi:MAG: T9SS type A sorting domain-containing protein [Crocinitomicaceae bacterium]|nr:T9SS type A sorting domain-containing protein [Crocinitomicaceae bacterium]
MTIINYPKYYLICIFITINLLLNTIAFGQNAPIDFEPSGFGATWNWTTFENDTNPQLQIIANPDVSGINTSSSVAKFTALQSGQPFAGCETMHGAGIGSFTIDSSNMMVKIMVWKTTISDIGIKLVRFDNWSLGEIKIPNTKIQEWEELTFDFSSHIGLTYDQLVIFPDFAARTSNNVILFDNIFGQGFVTNNPEKISGNQVKLFPNPTHNTLSIIANDVEGGEVILSNILGKVVLQQKFNSKQFTLDISQLVANSTYSVSILDAQGKLIETKLIVVN